MAKFRPGDRVLVEAVVESVTKDGGAYLLPGASRNLFYLDQDNLHPLPTPAQKLRDAAEVLVAMGWENKPGYVPRRLLDMASHLEAAAAPRPTLRDLVEEAVGIFEGLAKDVDACAHLADDTFTESPRTRFMAALSREEASHA